VYVCVCVRVCVCVCACVCACVFVGACTRTNHRASGFKGLANSIYY